MCLCNVMLCSAKEAHVQNTLFFHLTWIKTALISASYSCYADSVRVKVTTYHWKAKKKTRDFICLSEHVSALYCVCSVCLADLSPEVHDHENRSLDISAIPATCMLYLRLETKPLSQHAKFHHKQPLKPVCMQY